MSADAPSLPRTGGATAWKLGAVVVAVALTSGALLSVRQQRIQIASDLMRVHHQTEEHRHATMRLRARIAEHETVDNIAKMAATVGPMRTITADEWRGGHGVRPVEAIDAGAPSAPPIKEFIVPPPGGSAAP